MYSGNYFSQRYSRLSQIDKENVGQLEMQWAFQLEHWTGPRRHPSSSTV